MKNFETGHNLDSTNPERFSLPVDDSPKETPSLNDVWQKIKDLVPAKDPDAAETNGTSETRSKTEKLFPSILDDGTIIDALSNTASRERLPNSTYELHGHTYKTDSLGNVVSIDGVYYDRDNKLGRYADVAKATVGTIYNVITDTLYETIKGTAEGMEGHLDTGLSLVADLSGICGKEDFRDKVIAVIKKDYSGSILDFIEPLNNNSLDNMGSLGTVLKTVARAAGMIAGGELLAGHAVTSVLHGETGNAIEAYYTHSEPTNNVNDDITKKISHVNTAFKNIVTETVPAIIDVKVRTIATAVDMVGNFTLGVTKFGEGIIDETVSIAGMGIPSFRDKAVDSISNDFAGNTVGKFFDSITEYSYLNDNELGYLIEGVCQGVGQIVPAIALTVATGGAAGVNLGLLMASSAGNNMEKALTDCPDVSYEKAFLYAQVSGASEGAVEALSGGIGAYGPGLVKEFGKSFAGSVIGEGLEEAISGAIAPITEKIYKDVDLKETYQSTEFWQGITEQFIIGAGTAAVAQGLSSHIITDTKTTSETEQTGTPDGSVDVETKAQTDVTIETKQYLDDNGVKYREGNELVPNTTFERNGYTYETNEKGLVIRAEGKLQVKDHTGRSEMPDSRDVVGHGEMASTDDRGHLIADRFNGVGELENLVPMDAGLNRGDFAKLESTLADAIKDGAEVYYKVEPVYGENADRPTEFRVTYTIDGEKDVVVFNNRSGD